MKELVWKKEYSVGVDLFDRQHRRLFELTKELTKHSGDRVNLQVAARTLEEMFKYAQGHFTEEEDLMQKHNYPEIKTHIAQHAYFLKTTSELFAYSPQEKELSINEIIEFLNIWWTVHVLGWDMRYKEFFQEKLASSGR